MPAQLCHTEHARKITSSSYVWPSEYDTALMDDMTHVVYPAPFQRGLESEAHTAASPFFEDGFGYMMREIFFSASVYTAVDFLNAHGAWFSVVALPAIVIACLTGDLVIAAWCFVAAFIICWSLGFR